MLGSFAMYGNNSKGVCCNSGKKGINEAETQIMTETSSGNLILSDESYLPKEKQSEASKVREKIVNKYIYRDRPVEKVVYKDKVIEKQIPLTGSVYFPLADYTIFNSNLLTTFVKLIEEVTGCNSFPKDLFKSPVELSRLYKEHKNEFNPNINFAKVYQYIDTIKQCEVEMYNAFNQRFTSEDEKSKNESILKAFLIDINNIIYHILICTYEKSLMNLFNYYEYTDATVQAISNKKRNINTCVRIKERMNNIYKEWANLNFFSNVERFNTECKYVLDLNKAISDFLTMKDENNKRVNLSVNDLSIMLKVNLDGKAENVDELGNKTKSLKYLLRFSTMQILVDFVIGVNEKILDKLSFLSCKSENNGSLSLDLFANSTLKDVFYSNNAGKRKDQTIYVLIDKIVNEDFNTLKRIYDDLCYVRSGMFGNYAGNGVSIIGERSGERYDISSLCKLYTTVTSFKGDLCEYFKDNVFSLAICGNNDSSIKSQVTIPLNKLLNTTLAPGSFLVLKYVNVNRIANYCFNKL
jgi:hypothetical protein